MKTTIVICAFILGVALLLPFPKREQQASPAKREQHTSPVSSNETDKDLAEACECEHGSVEEEFKYANHLDPEVYRRIYDQLQEMPNENQVEGSHRKGVRATDISMSQWESFGPAGVPDKGNPSGDRVFGRIRTMRWYYNTGGGTWERYLGAGSGGLWFGQPAFTFVVWQSLGDKLPNPSVGAIAIDPTNPNVIFAGTGDWGRDNGFGVWKTTNRGASWTYNAYFGKYTTQLQYLLGNTIMIASGSNGVYRTTNGGSTWTHRLVEPLDTNAGCYNLVVVNSVRLYATLPSRGIYTSNDGGVSWSKTSTGLPTLPAKTIALDFAPSNSEVLYTAYTDTNGNQGGIFKSTNSGGSWTQTTNVPVYMIGGQGFHTNVIRVHPDDANTVYAGSVGFVKSTNGGSVWTNPVAGHGDHTAIEFDPTNSNLIYLCSDGGITLRDDAANTISSVNYLFAPGAPLQVYEMDYAYSDPQVMIAGTQDNGNMLTVNASQPAGQWLGVSGCDGGNHLNIDAKNSWTIYGNQWCGSNSPRWRTTDQGWTFDIIDNGLANGPYTPVRYAKGGPNILWTLSMTGLYNSYNGGDAWLASTTNLGNDFPGPYPWPALTVNNWATLSNKACYVVWVFIEGENKTLHNYILEGTPGAMTKMDLAQPFERLIPDRGNPDEVFGLRPGWIYKSTNHGHNWTNISGSYPNYIPGALPVNDVLEITAGGAIYAATSMGVVKSLDGGQNWFTFQNGLPVVSVQKLELISGLKYDTLRIATYGRGFWQRLIDDVNPILLVNQSVNGIVADLGGKNGVIFGGMSGGKGIKSTDAGNNWTELDFGVPVNLNAVGTYGDMTALVAGDMGTVVRTTNAGTTWNLTPVPTPGNITGLHVGASGMSWLCADDGTLLKSTNAGEEWLPQSSFPGVDLKSLQFMDDMNGMLLGRTTVGGSLPILYVTTNGGDAWTPRYPTTANNLHRLFFTSDSQGFAVGDSGTIVRTTDAGASWTLLQSGTFSNLYSCFFSDPMTGWAVGDSGTILKTNDAGESWIRVANASSGNLRSVSMSNQNVLFGGDHTAYHFAQVHENTIHFDLRNNWNLVSLPVDLADTSAATLFPSKISNAFGYNGTGYVVSGTLNGGMGYWLKFNGDQLSQMTGSPKGTLTIPVTPGWNLIGTPASITQTADIVSLPAGIITSQFFAYEGSYLQAHALQPGKAYWVKVNQAGTLTLGAPSGIPPGAGKISIADRGEIPPPPPGDGTDDASLQRPSEFALQQNFPNPFNPTTTIRFSLPDAGRVTVRIYDALGREVKTLIEGISEAGYKSIVWNSTDEHNTSVSSGLYFCKVAFSTVATPSRSFEKVQKMLLIK